jgi:hypothetical protein
MRRSILVLAVLAVASAVGACGGSPGSGTAATTAATTTTTATSDPAVAWVDKVCVEISELTEVQTTPPSGVQGDSAQKLKALDEYLAANIGALDQTVKDLRNVGPSPVAGGDQALNGLVNGLESLKKSYQETRAKFATVDLNNQQAAEAAVVEAFGSLGQGIEDMSAAFRAIEANPALQEAGRKAPNCQKWNPTTATPTS